MEGSTLDFSALFRWAVSALLAVGGWVFVRQSQSLVSLENRMNTKFDGLPETYARRDDVGHMFDQIISRLDHIQSSIDKKADKNGS